MTEKIAEALNGNMYQSTTANSIHTIDEEEPEVEYEQEYDETKVIISQRKLTFVSALAIISTLLAIVFLVILIVVADLKFDPPYCDNDSASKIPRQFKNPGILDDITPVEMAAVRDFLLSQEELNLTPHETATLNSSYIYLIDLHNAVKYTVIRYLDRGHKPPQRTAKVVIIRGDTDPPRVEEYLVGPLTEPSYYKRIFSPAHRKRIIPYTDRPPDVLEYAHIEDMLNETAYKAERMFTESYGMSFQNCPESDSCLMFTRLGSGAIRSGERRTWYILMKTLEGFHLHALGFQVLIDHSTNDASTWYVARVVYNDNVFYNMDDLAKAYEQNRVHKLKLELPVDEGVYSSFRRREWAASRQGSEGPRLTEPAGHRFDVDGRHVSYKDWNVNFRMKTSNGLQLYDVRFQGERIAYEVSLQDIVLYQSGHRPAQMSHTQYGVPLMLGASSFELVRGVDCPDSASFIDAYHFVNTGKPVHIKNAICVFENNLNIPLKRHFAFDSHQAYHSYGGLVDYTLVIRAIMTINNFDYILDYIFHANGVLEVTISTTGYIQATLDTAFERMYGSIIHHNTVAGFHHHFFHFKMDVDVVETNNRFSAMNFVSKTERNPWVAGYNSTQLIYKNSLIGFEQQVGSLNDFSGSTKFVIYKARGSNKFGAKRAFTVENTCATKFVLRDADSLKSAKWAKYPIAITQEKDFEETSASLYEMYDPFDPLIDFDSFLADNHTIIDTDLVFWFAMGQYHIPHSEDVPSETTTGNQCTLRLKPYNFFRESPSTSSSDIVRIFPRNNFHDIELDTSGTESGKYCAQKFVGPQNFNGTINKYNL